MSKNNSTSSNLLFLSGWLLIHTLIPFAVMLILDAVDVNLQEQSSLANAIVFITLPVAIIGIIYLQKYLIFRYFSVHLQYWIRVTLIAVILGGGIYLLSYAMLWQQTDMAFIWLAITPLAIIVTAQWIVLRRHTHQAWVWVLSVTGGIVLSNVTARIIGETALQTWSTIPIVFSVPPLVTGLALLWLFNNKQMT